MSSPLETTEFKPEKESLTKGIFVGDFRDDDGQVISDLVTSTDAPATPVPEAISETIAAPAKLTQLISGAQRFDNANPFPPIRLLPGDVRRQEVTLEFISEAAEPTIADFVYIADRNGAVGTSSSGRLYAGKKLTLDLHTGEIWVLAGTLSAPGFLSYWSTTK